MSTVSSAEWCSYSFWIVCFWFLIYFLWWQFPALKLRTAHPFSPFPSVKSCRAIWTLNESSQRQRMQIFHQIKMIQKYFRSITKNLKHCTKYHNLKMHYSAIVLALAPWDLITMTDRLTDSWFPKHLLTYPVCPTWQSLYSTQNTTQDPIQVSIQNPIWDLHICPDLKIFKHCWL